MNVILCMLLVVTAWKSEAYSVNFVERRGFLYKGAAAATGGWLISSKVSQASDIKVTPIAHTYVVAEGVIKPLRENDATRYLTNAKVVYVLEGEKANPSLAASVLELSAKRKADRGAGVTPGNIHIASSSKDMVQSAESLGLSIDAVKAFDASAIAAIAAKLADGDTLVVGPITSKGMEVDGKLVADTAASLGVEAEGARSGGVLSILLDGPTAVESSKGGFPLSTILWYSF